MLSAELGRAVRDLRYLLDHDYPRESAVNFIANHYRLGLNERHLLARCVFSRTEVASHRAKAVDIAGVRGKGLGVDGYNVLITAESILTGKPVVLCDDGYVRDLRAIFGKYKMSPVTARALKAMVEVIAEARPSRVTILLDRQVSRSGELAAMVRQHLKQAGLRGDAKTATGVDLRVRGGFNVVASSDRAIIERAKAVWDLPAELLRDRANVLDLTTFR
ncbi:MAG: DUF434 domain-containing protein [Candidatus Hodarchaeaceae archaeon]|nr:DUF434 domain-containing protein [Candidatus Hodarchaeaceae archaeon]